MFKNTKYLRFSYFFLANLKMEFGSREFWPDGTSVEKANNTASDRSFLRDLAPGSTNRVSFSLPKRVHFSTSKVV